MFALRTAPGKRLPLCHATNDIKVSGYRIPCRAEETAMYLPGSVLQTAVHFCAS